MTVDLTAYERVQLRAMVSLKLEETKRFREHIINNPSIIDPILDTKMIMNLDEEIFDYEKLISKLEVM